MQNKPGALRETQPDKSDRVAAGSVEITTDGDIRFFSATPLLASLIYVLVSIGASGCAASCKTNSVAGLTVFVVDAAGKPVCDAEVTATEKDFSEMLVALPATPCFYSGVDERRGTYLVTVHGIGSTRSVPNVVVRTADACHVQNVTMTINIES